MIHPQKITHEFVVPPEQKMNAGTELQSERSERSVCSVRSGRSGKSETPSETVFSNLGLVLFFAVTDTYSSNFCTERRK